MFQISSTIPAEAAERQLAAEERKSEAVESFMAEALADVIDTIMLYGEYPRPRLVNGGYTSSAATRQFDLQEWLIEADDPADIAQFARAMLTLPRVDRDAACQRKRAEIERRLTVELRDSPLVLARAQDLAEEVRDE